jgi:SanA protein
MKLWIKRIGFVGLLGFVLVGFFILFSNYEIKKNAENFIYDDVKKIPPRTFALVLGTSKSVHGLFDNLFFVYRVNTAAELYYNKKVKHIIVSGDNKTMRYNEPRDMRKALRRLGVPDSVITMDFAGFRTFDSVVRCKKVFGVDSCIVVSQAYHNSRAIYIAQHIGLEAIAINAPYPKTGSKQPIYREILARARTYADVHFLNTQPEKLGKLEPIKL